MAKCCHLLRGGGGGGSAVFPSVYVIEYAVLIVVWFP